jgi:DinB superfamily
MSDLKFPIGKFEFLAGATSAQQKQWIDAIAATPANLRQAVAGMNDQKLDTAYRDGGWTVRQLVHHVADSHINSYVRFRLALTEDAPAITPYNEKDWAELPDAKTLPVEVSLGVLDGLHARWVVLLRSLDAAAFAKVFIHPAMGPVSVDRALQLYAWHGRHHVAHVTALSERSGW